MNSTDGTWSDVAELSNGNRVFAHSTESGEFVFRYPDGRDYLSNRYRQRLLHLRAAGSANGHVIAIGQGHDTGEALFSIDAGSLTSLGPSSGASPVKCLPSGDGWDVYVLRSTRHDVYHINQFGTYELTGSRAV